MLKRWIKRKILLGLPSGRKKKNNKTLTFPLRICNHGCSFTWVWCSNVFYLNSLGPQVKKLTCKGVPVQALNSGKEGENGC